VISSFDKNFFLDSSSLKEDLNQTKYKFVIAISILTQDDVVNRDKDKFDEVANGPHDYESNST
jgi:hypothetical protein